MSAVAATAAAAASSSASGRMQLPAGWQGMRRQRGPSSRQSQGQLGKKTCGWEPSGGVENSTTHPGPPPRLCPWATGRASWVHLQSDKGSGGAGREARRRRVAPASGSGQLPPKRVAGLRPTPATHPPILRGFSSFLIRSFSSRFSSSLRQKVPGKLAGPSGAAPCCAQQCYGAPGSNKAAAGARGRTSGCSPFSSRCHRPEGACCRMPTS